MGQLAPGPRMDAVGPAVSARRIVLALLIALVLVAVPGLVATPAHASDTVGLHLASAHSKAGYETGTLGVYVRRSDGLTAGVLRNSYGRLSMHAGWTFETGDRRFAITVGAITGYPAATVAPLVVPSVRIPLASPWAARLSLLPKPPQHGSATALHLSVERDF